MTSRTSSSRFALPRRTRWLGIAVVALVAFGPAVVTVPGAAQAAEDDSAVTVKWAGGNPDELQRYQADHAALTSDGNGADNGSGHWNDFKDLQVSVAKTADLTDEVVQVTVSGMASDNKDSAGSQNFVQVMQCWGPDPKAWDFSDTCVFGGWGGTTAANSLGNIGRDLIEREGGTEGYFDNSVSPPLLAWHFRAADGSRSEPFNVNVGNDPMNPSWQFASGLSAYFNESTSNEIPIGVLSGKSTTVPFQVQTAAAAPHLGCGDPASLAGERCWLVVVPRGTHSGERKDSSGCVTLGAQPWGSTQVFQTGSPFDPQCTFWDDRIVIPLDFAPAVNTCPAGAAEARVVGSELVAEALGSWQSTLCNTPDGASYSLATSSGDQVRSQLLTKQAGFAVVSDALTAENIGTADPALLESSELQYAPVANPALTIAYVALHTATNAPYPQPLKLTPRLLAKMLTQSYSEQLPHTNSTADFRAEYFFDAHRALSPNTDPEWASLGNPAPTGGPSGAFVTMGPQGDDAVRLLWQYVQSDSDAVAFLNGEPDPWGMTINPSYLPAGNPRAVGGGLPYDIATEPLDIFPRADPTTSPDAANALRLYNGKQVDSVTLLPYSTSLAANADRIFHTDSKVTAEWDSSKPVGNERGAFVPAAPQSFATGRLMFGPTTGAAAARLQLPNAELQLPNSNTFVGPADDALAAAVAAQTVDAQTGVASTDFATLPDNAYPLTSTLYGAVDVADGALETEQRSDYAALLEYAATDGQVSGSARGQLPEGYLPLTKTQRAEASALAAELRTVPPVAPPAAPAPVATTPVTSSVTVPAKTGATAAAAGAATAVGQTQSTQTVQAAPAMETTASTTTTGQGALGGSLLAGFIGLVAAPFLLRRRRAG